jgi:hypothetical protein
MKLTSQIKRIKKAVFSLLYILLLSSSYISSAQNNVDLLKLKKSYLEKNKTKFIESFPNNFENFKSVFGWNDKLDKPNVLYSEANNFINYFFELSLNNDSCKKIIIKIATQAKWEADGVNYFHINLVSLVENDRKFDKILETLNDNDINAFWRFYFDIENLVFSSKLYTILGNSMKDKAMFAFNTLRKERASDNDEHEKLYSYQIFDKDGYCNLRKEDNAKSEIIGKLENNEVITVLDNTNDWWFILTKKNIFGFVHKSRIKVKNKI